MSFKFNPFTGNFDIVSDFALSDVDRLTSANATLVLSDDATDQTLTGSDGDLNIVADTNINLGSDLDLVAQKILADYSTVGTAHEFISLAYDIDPSATETIAYNGITVAFDFAVNPVPFTAYTTTHVSLLCDYDLATAGLSYTSSNLRAVDVDADLANTGFGHTCSLHVLRGQIDANSQVSILTRPIDVKFENPATSQAFNDGFFSLDVAGNSGQVVAAYTRARPSGAGSGLGYKGYSYNSTACTGFVTGVQGYAAANTNSISKATAIDGTVALFGAPTLGKDKCFSFAGSSGHIFVLGGSIWTSAATAFASLAPTHVSKTAGGSSYVEEDLEVDGITYMDGGGQVGADPGGLASFLGLTNVFPALGGGSAATLGTIGGSGPSTAAQAGWIKMYNGTTAIFVPYWT